MFYLNIIGWGLILFSLIAIISGIVGMFRLPDFYPKIHAAGLIDSCGVPMALVGLACLQTSFACSFKLILAALLVFLLSPVSTHALTRAAAIESLASTLSRKTEDD